VENIHANSVKTVSTVTSKNPLWVNQKGGSVMAKFHARPSNQYRYEHYDPWIQDIVGGIAGVREI